MRFAKAVPERAALRAAPLAEERLRLEAPRATAFVIDREDVDVFGADHVVSPIRKAMHASATYSVVLDGIDLRLSSQSIKASIDRTQENITESFLS